MGPEISPSGSRYTWIDAELDVPPPYSLPCMLTITFEA